MPTDTYYYGVKFAKGCSPNDLWSTYFTSSKIVKNLIETYGKNSFTYEIRRIFVDRQSAIDWEYKVLKKILNISNKNRNKWLNVRSGKTFNVTSEVMKLFWARSTYKDAQKQAQNKTWTNQELRIKHSNLMKSVNSTDMAKMKNSIATTKIWSNRNKDERKSITKHGTEKNIINAIKRKQEYENNKKHCFVCNASLSFEKRKNSYCSRKCSAIYGARKK